MDGNIEQTIVELKKHEPFEPFRIVTTSGEKYLIEDPESLIIGDLKIFYCVPRSDSVVYIRKNQIVAIEEFQKTRQLDYQFLLSKRVNLIAG